MITTAAFLAADHSNPLVPEANETIWALVCFVVLFVVLSFTVFPKIGKILGERSDNIEGKLDEAERERQQAADLLKQYQQKLDEASLQASQILETARQNGDRLEEELRAQAEDQARRIVERAQETIDAEKERALTSLRSEVGGLAVDLASRVVGESLDRDRQLKLVDQYIADLPSVARGEGHGASAGNGH